MNCYEASIPPRRVWSRRRGHHRRRLRGHGPHPVRPLGRRADSRRLQSPRRTVYVVEGSRDAAERRDGEGLRRAPSTKADGATPLSAT
jgi:hypothetical protein